jgi:DNA-directed RNA polymerase specialized sigma24 family protein
VNGSRGSKIGSTPPPALKVHRLVPYRIVWPPRSVEVMQDSIVDRRKRIEDLYRVESQRMWRALFAHSGDPDIASDALAEAFARALRDLDQIRDPAAWWRVAFRLAASELRSRVRSNHQFGQLGYEMPEPVPELVTALRQLSPNQRLALVLHDYADRSTREVAVTMGCAQATVRPGGQMLATSRSMASSCDRGPGRPR